MMATLSKKQKKVLKRILISAGLLILIKLLPLTGWLQGVCCLIPYLIIGYDVLRKAVLGIVNGQVFDENFLMPRPCSSCCSTRPANCFRITPWESPAPPLLR